MVKQQNITFVINAPRGGRVLPANAKVVYPKGYKKTIGPSSYVKYTPPTWENPRPAGDDNLNHHSRRGDKSVPHQGPISLIGKTNK